MKKIIDGFTGLFENTYAMCVFIALAAVALIYFIASLIVLIHKKRRPTFLRVLLMILAVLMFIAVVISLACALIYVYLPNSGVIGISDDVLAVSLGISFDVPFIGDIVYSISNVIGMICAGSAAFMFLIYMIILPRKTLSKRDKAKLAEKSEENSELNLDETNTESLIEDNSVATDSDDEQIVDAIEKDGQKLDVEPNESGHDASNNVVNESNDVTKDELTELLKAYEDFEDDNVEEMFTKMIDETAPVFSPPKEEPIEKKPVVEKKVETKAPERKPVVEKKVETKAPERKPVVEKKVETKAPERKPVVEKKVETKVPEKKPVVEKKVETKVPEKKPVVEKKVETKAPEKKPVVEKKVEVKAPKKAVEEKTPLKTAGTTSSNIITTIDENGRVRRRIVGSSNASEMFANYINAKSDDKN